MAHKRVLAFDLGASSGRAMLAEFNGEKITLKEVHRFKNEPVRAAGRMSWDILRLFHEIKEGIRKASAIAKYSSIGIDTWGVDFGLIDKNGRLLNNPACYRDSRTYDVPQLFWKKMSKNEIYEEAGIQFIHFNTLYQLYYMLENEKELLGIADKILLMPDLIAYLLTGEKRTEITNASTTNMLDAYTKSWSAKIIEKLGIDKRLFADFISCGERYGELTAAVCEELEIEPVPVVAVPTHDTASAVLSVPSEEKEFVYISCGTWSLFGTELRTPIINARSSSVGYTNETGFDNTTRFLKNISGLWLIQEARRYWSRETEVSFSELETEARAAEGFKCFINCDLPQFEAGGNIPQKVVDYCKKTGQYVPASRGEIARCIYDSLAMKYKMAFEELRDITGREYDTVYMVGGGIKDRLLCSHTASALGVKVSAGPTEATAMGNVVSQFIAMGAIEKNDARRIIKNSCDIEVYMPQHNQEWNKAYETYKNAIGKGE